MNPTPPYLSIVLVARNDNYSGDFNARLHNALHWLAALVEKHKLPAELLIVDYNPIAENPSLLDTFRWPQNRKHLAIRLLHVSREAHNLLVQPDVRRTVPVFEFIAKNIAIRRAKGEYILCTNADILFHPGIIRFLANKLPDKKHYYRADRFDYKKIDHYDFNRTAATLRKIQRSVFRLMLKGYAYPVSRGENFFEETRARLRNIWRLCIDRNMLKIEPLAHRFGISVNYDGFLMKYHTHCSGDFMLMHRDHWLRLRGYPEDTLISTHCDALLTVMAAAAGLRETILPWHVYHQDHDRRYNTDFDINKNNSDINLMFQRLLLDAAEMERARQPKIINSADWGHRANTFAETLL